MSARNRGIDWVRGLRGTPPSGRGPALIGMVHLRPLPGAPRFEGRLSDVVDAAVREASALRRAGFDAIMVENFGDVPFYKSSLPPETIAALTRCALAVREETGDLPLGINALRNDGHTALAIAAVVEGAFIRVNVLTGAMLTDQGLIEGEAASILRRRAALAPHVAIIADVFVKHATPLAQSMGPDGVDLRQLAQVAIDTALRGGADALIVSGSGTGSATDPVRLAVVRQAVTEVPVLVGSGTTTASLGALLADGFIIGTALKVGSEVDEERARMFVSARDALARAHSVG